MQGIIFTLLSAASFGANNIVVRRGLIRMSAAQGLYITVLLGIPLFVVAALLTGQLANASEFSSSDIALLATAGVIHFVVGRYCTFRAVAALGANRTMPIQATSGFYSVLIAVIFLHEQLNPLVAVGIVLVMVGPALIAEGSRRENRSDKSSAVATPASGVGGDTSGSETAVDIASEPGGGDATVDDVSPPPTRLVEGYVFGLLSAVAYGTSPVFIRAALQDSSDLGIVGGLVSYVAAGIVLVVGLLFVRRGTRPWSFVREDRTKAKWFVFATVGVFFAQFFRYLALAYAPVSLVVPLTHTRPIFTVMFSYAFNRHLESFSPSTLIGIGISLVGALAIGIGSL